MRDKIIVFVKKDKEEKLTNELQNILNSSFKVSTKSVKALEHIIENFDDRSEVSVLLEETWWKSQKLEDQKEFLEKESYGLEVFLLSNNKDLLKDFKKIKKHISIWSYKDEKRP